MFAVNARRLFYVCDKYFVRNIATGRRLDIRHRNDRRNPGLDNRLAAFQADGIQIPEGEDIEEFMEESESNFYEVDEVYDKHLEESLIGKHELRHHIVKEKYFKENMPNLLTWSEKEQIRHLATTQPNEWTPERIAESFPVTEQVVKKLLKYPWKPASEQRIARHDASAMRNWRELKEGSLDIPDHLRQHFLKFSERTIPPTNRKSNKIEIPKEKMGEFEEIIMKYARNEKHDSDSENIQDNRKHESNTSKKGHVKTDYKIVTLDELATKIKTRLEQGQNVNVPDRIMADTIQTVPDKMDENPELNKEIELYNDVKEEKSLAEYKERDDKVIGVQYPERIRIPKKAYKRGATYKMNDCFYDDDGRFLYRVIGMNNNN